MSVRKENIAAACAVLSCLAMNVGWFWDISWHRSIGRDTIWTPPHVSVYVALAIATAYTAWLIWTQTFGPDRGAPGIRVLGLSARAGTLVTAWSVFAQGASFVFDKWWHDVYGVDSAVMTPPHAILAVGVDGFFIGQILLLVSLANTADGRRRRVLHVALLFVLALLMGNFLSGLDPLHGPLGMRAKVFMISGAITWPATLVLAWSYLKERWSMVTACALFMVQVIVIMQLVQFLPASQKFGPVFHPVTRLLPPSFPILLIVPALALTLLFTWSPRLDRWGTHVMAGALFVVTAHAANWALSEFLLSPLAANRFFAGGLPPAAFVPDTIPVPMIGLDAGSAGIVALSAAIATVSSRCGHAVGTWARGLGR